MHFIFEVFPSLRIKHYLINKYKYLMATVFLIGMVASCEKEPSLSNVKAIQEFRIEASLNSNILKKDIEGIIEGNKITLYIPEEIDITGLVASFVYTGKEILIDSQEQVSAISVNNFSENLVYTVKAEDGSELGYSVNIESIEDIGLLFKSFSFRQEFNSNHAKDYDLELKGNELTGKIKSKNKNLIATFETEAVTVSIDGVVQESGKSEVDFSNPVIYTL